MSHPCRSSGHQFRVRFFQRVLSVVALSAFAFLNASPPGRLLTGQILVKSKAGVSDELLESLVADAGAQWVGVIEPIGVRILRVTPDRLAGSLERLTQDALVEFAEADAWIEPAVIPNDPFYPSAWHLPRIAAPSAWDLTLGNPSVVIAVLDSGIDSNHPDLTGKVVAGWNFFDSSPDTTDLTGHGTSVAGAAAAATGNAAGVSGVAWNCVLMPIRVTDLNGYASVTALSYGLTYAADHGARVANISFRASGSATIRTAANYFRSKGGVVTVSAGNESFVELSPDNPEVLTVSSTDSADLLSGFSNSGNNIDLAAPGENILTTTLGGDYGSGTGTSYSAPVVAGVAALVISANPALTAAQVEEVLKVSADDLGGAGWDASFGAGRVNAHNAVLLAIGIDGGNGTVDVTAPIVNLTSPVANSTISGITTVGVTAIDDRAVVRVEFYVNGVLVESAASASAAFSWDSRTTADGVVTLVAKAFDAAGNSGMSAPFTVTVHNAPPADLIAPQVTISNPVSGTRLNRSTKVTVAASDNVAISRIDLFVDGKHYATTTAAPAVFNWNTSKLAKGAHTLQASASDAAGNVSRSILVTVFK